MADYKTQIEGLTGLSVGTTPTNDEVSQFLVDGTTEVANRITVLNPADMSKFCETTNSTTSVVKTGRILSVMREHDSTSVLRSCVPISPESRYDATDLESLNYRSKFNPAFYELDGVIHAIPAATSGNNDIVVTQVYYATNTGHSSSSIDNFPYEYEYLVVLYASVKSLQNALSGKDSDLPSDLTEPLLGNIITSLPVYTGPSSFVLPVPPPGVDVDFTDVGTIDEFIKPVFFAPSLGTISAMSLASAPVAPGITTASVTITGTAPTYVTPVLSLTSTPTITDLNISAVIPVVPSLTDISVVESSITAPTFIAPAMGELDFSDTNNWISSEEDSEMLTARVNEINTKIQEHQARLQESVSVFQKENTIMQKDLQIALTNAQLSSEDDNKSLQKYSAEVQSYASLVQTEVQEYQINLESDLRVWENERNNELQKYQLDMQNSLNVFNKENTEYQAKLQKDVSDAQFVNEKDSKSIQNYSADIQNYSASINKEVQRWTGEVFNKEFNEWTQKYQGQLGSYGTDIQNETSRVNASSQNYQTKVNKTISQYQAETGYDMSKYQNEIQASISKFEADLTLNSTNFQNNLGNYSAEVNKVSADNQILIVKYQHQVSDYMNKLQKVQATYEWMMGRLTMLQQQYDTSFSIMAPKQQQQGEQ